MHLVAGWGRIRNKYLLCWNFVRSVTFFLVAGKQDGPSSATSITAGFMHEPRLIHNLCTGSVHAGGYIAWHPLSGGNITAPTAL